MTARQIDISLGHLYSGMRQEQHSVERFLREYGKQATLFLAQSDIDCIVGSEKIWSRCSVFLARVAGESLLGQKLWGSAHMEERMQSFHRQVAEQLQAIGSKPLSDADVDEIEIKVMVSMFSFLLKCFAGCSPYRALHSA